MPYMVVKITPEGQVNESVQQKAPTYEEQRKFVDGLIQFVPHLSKLDLFDLKRGQMVVNEEGQLLNLAYNPVATQIWRENLGKGPFSYEPRLYGNAIYWAKVPKIK